MVVAAGVLVGLAHSEPAKITQPSRLTARRDATTEQSNQFAQRTATIHWRQVPLRDAIARLEKLFRQTVFVDRRVDPGKRVSLDIEASSIDDVLKSIADANEGVCRLGRLIYFGPRTAAEQLAPLAELRGKKIAKSDLSRRDKPAGSPDSSFDWPRLTQPRELVSRVVEDSGWRIENAEMIPHDLWPAGNLPDLKLAEKLTVLLIGFDLTFAVQPSARTLRIVRLEKALTLPRLDREANRSKPSRPARTGETKQVYTLRVAEQPVGAVLHELARRLEWPVDIDDEAIRAAGLSLDQRVSFAVENVERDALLEALLRPAKLDFRHEGGRIRIVPRD